MKIYRKHNCSRTHRTWATLAACMWPRAAWITGNGRYAVVARCRALTVTLHETIDDAEMAKRVIDGSACGGMCWGNHELIEIRFDG